MTGLKIKPKFHQKSNIKTLFVDASKNLEKGQSDRCVQQF
jgi:hypothetical protein